MKLDPDQYHRRTIRLPGHNYANRGAYFVTICTQDRECILGDIVDGQMASNDAGIMAESIWQELPARYGGVELDAFVVMPNHLHGIVVLVGAGPRACPDLLYDTRVGQPQGVAPTRTISLSDVIHRFNPSPRPDIDKAFGITVGRPSIIGCGSATTTNTSSATTKTSNTSERTSSRIRLAGTKTRKTSPDRGGSHTALVCPGSQNVLSAPFDES